ncbi:MAG: sensor histidine kinase, partial [Chloroflexota bacterium]|nr:sensor histidine kinase [Chloroflexota bacterium]
IAYFFWLAGTLSVMLIRPQNKRWLLMSGFYFLTAVWLIAGSGVSSSHIWYSALILRIAIWLCVPVYLHLHWVFPRPLGKLPPPLVWIVYGGSIVLAIMQGLQLVPNNLYLFGFLIAVGGSLILLVIHIWHQPSVRRDFRLLLVLAVLALGLPLIWAVVSIFFGIPASLDSAGLLSFPLLPVAYLYAAYRGRLGALELRVNRFIAVYLFLILVGTIGIPLLALADHQPFTLIIGSTVSILTTLAYVWGFPAFQSFVEKRILGIPLPPKRLLETYTNRITTSNSSAALVRVLETEIIPSLLIRQFVFLQSDHGTLKVLSKLGVDEAQIPTETDMPGLMTPLGVYRSPDLVSGDQPYSWIRLVLPLKLGEETNGFWLFGRRDPDDIYSQLEIPILQSLASQTAIALSNILQTERLKSMYAGNIDRYEQERLRLSRDLHDSIMNEMAALLMREDAPVFSPEFQGAFEALTERLREIVTDLRPPSLTFGLKPALEDLADGLSERNREKVKIVVGIQADGEWRYPDKVENHLYRIVQEACGNALKYAHAKTIRITGKLSRQKIELTVEDDGVGFDAESKPNLDETHASKHYGLTGMHERASLTGAEVHIDSKPSGGTRIRVIWESDKV